MTDNGFILIYTSKNTHPNIPPGEEEDYISNVVAHYETEEDLKEAIRTAYHNSGYDAFDDLNSRYFSPWTIENIKIYNATKTSENKEFINWALDNSKRFYQEG